MTVLFKNADSGNYFLVDPSGRAIVFLTKPVASNFLKYQRILNIQVFTLPDLATIKEFHKLAVQGVLDDNPEDPIVFWTSNYSELFI